MIRYTPSYQKMIWCWAARSKLWRFAFGIRAVHSLERLEQSAERFSKISHFDMKYLMRLFLPLFVVLGVCACTPSTPAANLPYPDQNFAFTFEFGSCNRDILDTFSGTFTKDMIVDPAITIPFRLSDSQTTEIYQKMVEIGFFEYPENFSIPIPKNGTIGMVTPAMRYQMTLQNGDLTKTLLWVDDIIDPTTLEAENLRSLFSLIINMIQNSEEYEQLPEPQAGCA